MKTNITDFQTQLISQLKSEFERLNPTNNQNSLNSRFSIQTIEDSLNQKNAFIESIKEYNRTMIKSLESVFYSEIDSFVAEFDKYFTIIIGTSFSGKTSNTYDEVKNIVLVGGKIERSLQICFYITSKIRKSNDDYGRYTNGMAHKKLYCHFKTENSSLELENGEKIGYNKIKGIYFSTEDWLHQDYENNKVNDTLMGLLNNNKNLQIYLTDMCKPNN